MQTFLPYPDFVKSVKTLDRPRLGKQRVEAMQILNACKIIAMEKWPSTPDVLGALTLNQYRLSPTGEIIKLRKKNGWVNHPAVRMWIGYEEALGYYMDCCIDEWLKRGYHNTINKSGYDIYTPPPWLGDERLHSSHRAALLDKRPHWYRQFKWLEKPEIKYYWPVR